jgi:hypothetical protein
MSDMIDRQTIPRVEIPGVGYEHVLQRVGTMRQTWWKVCKGCEHRLDPGDISVLGTVKGVRDWMCVACAIKEGLA